MADGIASMNWFTADGISILGRAWSVHRRNTFDCGGGSGSSGGGEESIAERNVKIPAAFREWTALHGVIASNSYTDVARVLKGEAGSDFVDVNDSDFRGRTPCMFAVEMGSLNALETLMMNGGDTSKRGVMHMNALHMAVFCGNVDAVHMCLNSGRHNVCTSAEGTCVSAVSLAASANLPDILDVLLDTGPW